MSRYPGAYWRPAGTNQGQMRRIRALSLHEAVTRSMVPATGRSNIWSWVDSENSCHIYDDKVGAVEQYKEFGEIAYGVLNGNSEVLTYESYDGLLIQQNPYREIPEVDGEDANHGRWSEQQCERKADVIAFLNITEGLQIRAMQTSDESGVGGHRLGVDPWRVSGTQSWTAHPGKPCPGDKRLAQIPGILARAQTIANAVKAGKCTWLPTGPVNMGLALSRTSDFQGGPTPPKDEDMTADQVLALLASAKGQAALAPAIVTVMRDSKVAQNAVGGVVDDRLATQFTNAKDNPNAVLNSDGVTRRIELIAERTVREYRP